MATIQKISGQGQWIFGLAIAGLGAKNLIAAHLAETKVSAASQVPAHPWMAYVVGIVILAAGRCIAANWKARPAAIFLGAMLIAFAVLLEAPRAMVRPLSISLRTIVFEPLALGAAALVLGASASGTPEKLNNTSGPIPAMGRWIFGISLVVFGVDHFLVFEAIAGLEPAWTPGKMFWACLTGAGFVAAGVSIATMWMGKWGGFFLGVMFLLWFVLLHAPRTLGLYAVGGRPRNPNEWSSLSIAVGMCGSGWICAEAIAKTEQGIIA